MYRVCIMLMALSATFALAEVPAAEPAVPPEFSNLDLQAFLKSFADTYRDGLELTGHSFAPNNTSANKSKASSWLILHVRPRHEGFYLVRYDVTFPPVDFPRPNHESYEFYFTVAPPHTQRSCYAAHYEPVVNPLANVGDTILLPLPNARYADKFFKETHAGRLPEVVAEAQRKDALAVGQLPKQFARTPGVEITNHAEAKLHLVGTALGSMGTRKGGISVDSCTVLLEAREPGEFMLESVLPPHLQAPGNAMHLAIVAADQPVRILVTHIECSGSAFLEFRPYPDSIDLPPITLRVGDLLTIQPWEQHVNENPQPHKVQPPAILLEQKPLHADARP